MKRLDKILLTVGGATLAACAAALLVPEILERRGVAITGRSRSDVHALHAAACEFILLYRRAPEALEDLTRPDEYGYRCLDRDAVPLDIWNRQYRYEPPSADDPLPRVYTLGADGVPGGEGPDADVDSREDNRPSWLRKDVRRALDR